VEIKTPRVQKPQERTLRAQRQMQSLARRVGQNSRHGETVLMNPALLQLLIVGGIAGALAKFVFKTTTQLAVIVGIVALVLIGLITKSTN
jgi:hypothetical protein